MANKILKTRVQNKCDTAANWKLATNFKPLKGEIILYTDTKQMKVGDGNTLVNNLPFYPSGDVTAAGNNTFTGSNTFRSGFLQVGGDNTHITLNDNGIESGGIKLLFNSPSSGTFNYKFPCKKTVDESPVNIVTENENNTFSGTNTFKDTVTFKTSADPNQTTTINTESIKVDNGEITGGTSATLSASQLRLYNGGAEATYNMDSIYFDGHTFNYPTKDGTFALTSDVSDYVQANPTASSTTSLTKLKVGNTVYGLSSGDGSTTVISKTISAWPTATAPVSISFTTDENSKISNKDTFKNVIIQVGVNDKNYACLYPVGYGNIVYRFASSDNGYTLIITGGVGSMTYTKPAEIAGNNTFTGSNTFSTVKVQTNAQTYTTISPTNISGKSGGASYSLVLPVKTSTLATLDDLSSLFTYADNTLTINI